MKNRTEELKLLSDCQLTKFEVLKELEYLREYHEIRATGGDSAHGRGAEYGFRLAISLVKRIEEETK